MPPPSDAQRDERQLLAAFGRGERCAATQIVEHLAPVVRRTVFRLTGWHPETQDLVQDVFLAIQQAAGSFRGDSRLETWATSITIHCCRKWQRKQNKRPGSLADTPFEPVDESFQGRQGTGELKEEVQLALQQLGHEDRELIVLRYLEDYALEDLAELLEVRKNTVEVRLSRARRRLADFLLSRSSFQSASTMDKASHERR